MYFKSSAIYFYTHVDDIYGNAYVVSVWYGIFLYVS
jgi:hypothetical protein